MALATRCPHCQTAFRVASDQLKLRAGLVRCGTCKQIFNGIENLLHPDEDIAAAVAASAPALPEVPLLNPSADAGSVAAQVPSSEPQESFPESQAFSFQALTEAPVGHEAAEHTDLPLDTLVDPDRAAQPGSANAIMSGQDSSLQAPDGARQVPDLARQAQDFARQAQLQSQAEFDAAARPSFGSTSDAQPQVRPAPAGVAGTAMRAGAIEAGDAATVYQGTDAGDMHDTIGAGQQGPEEIGHEAATGMSASQSDFTTAGHVAPGVEPQPLAQPASLDRHAEVEAAAEAETQAGISLDSEALWLALADEIAQPEPASHAGKDGSLPTAADAAPGTALAIESGTGSPGEAKTESTTATTTASNPALEAPSDSNWTPTDRPDAATFLSVASDGQAVPRPIAGDAQGSALPMPALLRAASIDDTDAARRPRGVAPVPKAKPPAPSRPVPEIAPDLPDFLMREQKRQGAHRALRPALWLLALLLTLGVIGQSIYAMRTTIAANFPQSRPALDAACRLLGCRVGLPMQIESVSIESNDFQPVAGSRDLFLLTVLLRNRGSTVQAWPSIELSLTDGTDKVVGRRVIAPREFLGAGQSLAKGFAAGSEQPIRLYFDLTQLKASGYRVYLFYP